MRGVISLFPSSGCHSGLGLYQLGHKSLSLTLFTLQKGTSTWLQGNGVIFFLLTGNGLNSQLQEKVNPQPSLLSFLLDDRQ